MSWSQVSAPLTARTATTRIDAARGVRARVERPPDVVGNRSLERSCSFLKLLNRFLTMIAFVEASARARRSRGVGGRRARVRPAGGPAVIHCSRATTTMVAAASFIDVARHRTATSATRPESWPGSRIQNTARLPRRGHIAAGLLHLRVQRCCLAVGDSGKAGRCRRRRAMRHRIFRVHRRSSRASRNSAPNLPLVRRSRRAFARRPRAERVGAAVIVAASQFERCRR